MNVPAKYRWIVDSIAARRRTEADQVRLVICWLVAFYSSSTPYWSRPTSTHCQRASARRNDASMNRLVYTIRNVYAELRSHGWDDGCDDLVHSAAATLSHSVADVEASDPDIIMRRLATSERTMTPVPAFQGSLTTSRN
jgi:hypothetical protein